MRVGTPGFIPGRLTEARAARRIPSMSALARQMGISPATVSRWEDGTSAPESEAMLALAQTLQVRPEFFLRAEHLSERPVFFRSLSSTLVRDLEYQKSQMRWLHEISALAQHYVDFPAVDIPDFMQGASYRQLRDEDIEQIALDLRRHWKMDDGPCVDMVAQLERVGFVVGSIEMGTARLDGLCSWSRDGRPHVLLASDKMSFPRRQMDAAHEMSHAILHQNVSQDELKKDLKFIETQAFRLASAFLMPSTAYPLDARFYSLTSFASLKERWRVSIKAQIKRVVDLDIIDAEFATHLYKLYSAKGWSKGEPLDRYWDMQQPRLLSDAFHLIVDSGARRKSDLLNLEFTMPSGDVENLCNLPAGWFSKEKADIFQLKLSAPVDGVSSEGMGQILPFQRS
jgi:Zn-dependent peptidase ImmA (M78 family)/transcriptional regulator with XRE-family HTH domain